MMMTFVYRLMGAAMLDGGTYEQLEADPHATWQAMLVIVLSSIAAGLGVGLNVWAGLAGFGRVAVVALITWVAWAVLTLQIGSRVLPQAQTRSDTGEMMRTIGFAAAPGLLQVFGIIPGVMLPVFAITIIWMFAAMVVAIQHALDYTNVGRALAVCGIAALIIVTFAFGLSILFGSTASVITRGTSSPNPLTRSLAGPRRPAPLPVANRSRLRSVWAPADSQDRTRRIADDVVRGRAQEREVIRGAAVQPHHDQVGGLLPRAPQDMRVGFVGRDKVLETQIGPADVFRGPTQPSRGVALQTAPERVHRHRHLLGVLAEGPTDRMRQNHPASMGRQYRRVMETTERRGREVHRTHDSVKWRVRIGVLAARRHGEHGAARFSQHLLGHRSDDEPIEPASSVRAHHDHIRRHRVGGFHDARNHRAVRHRDLHVGGLVPGKVHKGLELSAIRIAQISGQFESRPWPGRQRRQGGVHDLDHLQAPDHKPAERDGVLKRVA